MASASAPIRCSAKTFTISRSRSTSAPPSCLRKDSSASILFPTTVLLLSEFLQQISLRMTRWSFRSTTVSRPFVHHFRGRYFANAALGGSRGRLLLHQDDGRLPALPHRLPAAPRRLPR